LPENDTLRIHRAAIKPVQITTGAFGVLDDLGW
jgi:hypothetical protein